MARETSNGLKQKIATGIHSAKIIVHDVGKHLSENRTPYITGLVVIVLLGLANVPQTDGLLDLWQLEL